MSFRPTPQQERWIQIASRTSVVRGTPWLTARLSGWKAATSLTRCMFFVLGVFAAGLIAAVFALLHVSSFLFVTGVILVASAEWLILRRRLFGAGIEEALELVGSLMIALQSVGLSVASVEIRISLIVATVLLAAGLRLLNPFFINLSFIALTCAIDFAGVHHSVSTLAAVTLASSFCLAVAWVALYINRIQFRRPFYDQMLNWLIVTMPLAAYLWIESDSGSRVTIESLRAAPLGRVLPALMLTTFGLAALIVGIRRRSHAPIIAFMICVGCVAYELRNLTALSLQVKLICWGSVALLLTLGLDRYLRTPRRGITSAKFAESNGSLDLLQLAGASTLAPQSAQHPDAQFKGGGGGGGGGGASGTY
jgi:hypothetical protein